MSIYIKYFFIFLFVLFSFSLSAQVVQKTDSIEKTKGENIKFSYKQLIVPTTLIAYGLIGLENDQLKFYNTIIKEDVTEDIDDKFTIDDFLQYAPAVTVYGLNVVGIKGKNNFRDRSIILGTSYLLMSSTVYGLKTLTHVERPDKSGFNSFPSGHTATAFVGAEFLYQEYKDVSIWYGISGYLAATATGIFRIVNDKHWLTDVVMGAGIGILSTKVSYWIFPYIDGHIFKSHKKVSSAMIAPFYNGHQLGLGMVVNLK